MKQAVKNFKDAFENAVSVYDKLSAGQIVPTKVEDLVIKQLQSSYQSFCDALYPVLDQYTDWNTQSDVIYEGIRKEIDNDRMFGDEFRQNHCAASLDCLRIFGAIRTACKWFDGNPKYRLRSFQYEYKRGALGVRNNVAAPVSGVHASPAVPPKSQPEMATPQETNEKHIPRNQRIALLYNIFIRLGITQEKTDTEIAGIIEFITGGDSKKNAKNTYAARCMHSELSDEAKKLLNDFLPRK